MARVFISYSKKDYIGDDGKVVPGCDLDKIISALSSAGISYWIDREGLDGGVTFATVISQNIKECDTVLFLSTVNANASPWTLREISTAVDFGKKILPVRMDGGEYSPSVALYLSPVQYIDWREMGQEESLRRIVRRLSGGPTADDSYLLGGKSIPWHTVLTLDAALIVLTVVYAILTYQFLWAATLRSTEIMGGFVGYVCEFGVLSSIYYVFRLKRLRKSTFAFPALVTFLVFLAGLLLEDTSVLIGAAMLVVGWSAIAVDCAIPSKGKKSLLRQMDPAQTLLSRSDPENLLLIYLLFKALIIVVAHYLDLSATNTLISPFLF